MGLFTGPEETERRAKLKILEDRRMAFAQKLEAEGFRPETMLAVQSDLGGIVALCAFGGRRWLIVGPGYGSDEAYRMEPFESENVRREEVLVRSEGLGGILGFGKKGERGVEYAVTLADGSEVRVPFVFGRNGCAEFKLAKNPLLSTRRRRGDANVVWDMRPIDNTQLSKILDLADAYFGLK